MGVGVHKARDDAPAGSVQHLRGLILCEDFVRGSGGANLSITHSDCTIGNQAQIAQMLAALWPAVVRRDDAKLPRIVQDQINLVHFHLRYHLALPPAMSPASSVSLPP